MQVKVLQNAQREHSAILSTFIKLPFFIKIFVFSIFEWPFYTGFTVCTMNQPKFVVSNKMDNVINIQWVVYLSIFGYIQRVVIDTLPLIIYFGQLYLLLVMIQVLICHCLLINFFSY